MTIPKPPSHLLQRIANDPSYDSFVGSFPFLRFEVKRLLKEAGADFGDFDSILDFGCGVGRFLFAFQPDLRPGQRLFGCDVFKECADWCIANIPFATVAHNPIDPPLPYQDRQFDLVYALSVYTHLRLDLQFRWAWEIYRVLKPGGVLFATLHGPFFFPVFYEQYRHKAKTAEFHSFGDDALFAYLSYAGHEEDEGQVDVAAAHTFQFAREVFGAFELLSRVPQSRLAAGQDTYIIRKPADAKPIAVPLDVATGRDGWNSYRERVNVDRPISLKFHLDGQKSFRVYPSAEPASFSSLENVVFIRAADGRVLAEKTLPFNNNRVFGHSHHACHHVDVAPFTGDVTVELQTNLSERGTLPPGVNPTTIWRFPHFIG